MYKVQFLKDTSKALLDNLMPDTLLVYKDGYSIPEVNCEKMNFDRFRNVYSELHFNMLIIVGLNKIITPSNRTDMVNDFIQTMTRNIPKISIDNQPFIGEPWRLWYHYDVTNISDKFAVPHGYAIETEWQKWFYREDNNSRLSGENIKLFISDTYSDLDKLITEFELAEVNDSKQEWYDNLKEHIFSIYSSPKLFINNILKECNKKFDLDISYDSYRENKNIKAPDLGIYRFIFEENKRRMNIYNALIS